MPVGFIVYFSLIFILTIGSIIFSLLLNRATKIEWAIKRMIKKVPRSDIGQVSDGRLVKVVGQLSYLKEPLISPLTGRRCAYYEVIVEEIGEHGNYKSRWRRLVHDTESQDFLLRDGTGKALVRMDPVQVVETTEGMPRWPPRKPSVRTVQPQIVVTKDAKYRSGFLKDATPELEAFLQRYGKQSTRPSGFNRNLRYREGILEEGERVAVCGHAMREPDPDPGENFAGYREQPTRLVLQGNAHAPLYISDDISVIS